jgi:Protein of unknown function (DUF4056)
MSSGTGPRRSFKGGWDRSPGVRSCCMLCDRKGGELGNFLDDEPDSYRHQYGSSGLLPRDAVGLMYTCAGGFIDFGHLRDNADLTYYYFRALNRGKWRKGSVIEAPPGIKGTVTVLADVPATLGIDVARHLSYNESIYHEIETYWNMSTGAHHSAFSPEDLVSNYLGTHVAGQVLQTMKMFGGGDFSALTGRAIFTLMQELGVLPATGTEIAFTGVRTTWVRGDISHAIRLPDDYVKRRNFATWPLEPWLANGVPNCTGSTATFPGGPDFDIDLLAAAQVKAVYEVPEASRGPGKIDSSTVTALDFPTLIAAIKNDASTVYGADYDSPAPVGRRGP